MNIEELVQKIKEEAMKPTCMSLDYDPTPTGEERLKKIVKMIRRFEKQERKNEECGKEEPQGNSICHKPKNHSGTHDWSRDELG
jgi:hypothetical protein